MVSLQAALAVMALSGAGETVFLDFCADWCAPCRAMEPTIQALVAEGYPVRKINIDQNPALAAKYGVSQVPCYVMVVDGREVDRVVGGTTFSRLERMCKLASGPPLPNQSSPVLAHVMPPKTGPPVSFPPVRSRPPLSLTPQQTAVSEPPAQPPAAPAARDRRSSQGGWIPQGGTPADPDAELIAASVRLRIEDPHGQSCGSGTIIDAREGQALILTCGHIFRESQGKGRIEVDLFGRSAARRIPGRLISYDVERDVGLVAVHIPGPVTTARVAPPGYRLVRGSPVVSVGCNNGDRPSTRHTRVIALDRAVGPPNLQVAGQSVEGRSGGGLFSADGLVIGVCNAAYKDENESLYAAMGAIHAELDKAGLSYIYKSPPENPAPRAELAAVDPPPMPQRMPRRWEHGPPAESPLRPGPASVDDSPRLSAAEQAALDEIRRRLQEGAEVLVLVRSRRDPLAKSEIFTLDNASPNFLRQLAAEARIDDSRGLKKTLLEIPRRRQSPSGWSDGAEGWRRRRVEPAAGR